ELRSGIADIRHGRPLGKRRGIVALVIRGAAGSEIGACGRGSEEQGSDYDKAAQATRRRFTAQTQRRGAIESALLVVPHPMPASVSPCTLASLRSPVVDREAAGEGAHAREDGLLHGTAIAAIAERLQDLSDEVANGLELGDAEAAGRRGADA